MFLFATAPTRDVPPASPVVDAIRRGAERTGATFDYLLATARRESGLDPGARARTSSASGLFQFIEQTWLGLIKSDGAKAGLSHYAQAIATRADGSHRIDDPGVRDAVLKLRHDPEVAAVMAGALTQRNGETLRAEIGREPSQGELYAAHFLGARGAADLIHAAGRNPDRSAASLFPDAAGANRPIFYDQQGRARGAGEVYALLTRHREASSAAPAFAPDRPVAFAEPDGPAFHGLFRTGGRVGPISETVAKLWQTGRPAPGDHASALAYFPNLAGASTRKAGAPEGALEPTPVPLPPPRPAPARPNAPLDLSTSARPSTT